MTGTIRPLYYTEARHTVYGSAPNGVDIIDMGPYNNSNRWFRPARFTVHYDWRTQLDHTEWHIGTIEITGPWVNQDGSPDERYVGTACVLYGMYNAPQWAKDLATVCMPTHIRLVIDRELVDMNARVPNFVPARAVVPELLDDLMWMGSVPHDGHVIEQYKHHSTRRYINLDETCQPWRVVVEHTGGVLAERITLDEAKAHVLS